MRKFGIEFLTLRVGARPVLFDSTLEAQVGGSSRCRPRFFCSESTTRGLTDPRTRRVATIKCTAHSGHLTLFINLRNGRPMWPGTDVALSNCTPPPSNIWSRNMADIFAGDLIRPLGILTLYFAYAEYEVDLFLEFLSPIEPFDEKWRQWSVGRSSSSTHATRGRRPHPSSTLPDYRLNGWAPCRAGALTAVASDDVAYGRSAHA